MLLDYVKSQVELFKQINSNVFFTKHSLFNYKKFLLYISKSGVGGQEASLFASELEKHIQNLLNWLKIKFTICKNYILIENQNGIFDILFAFMGIHRIQRVPVTDKKGRRQTSTCSLLIYPSLYLEIDQHYILNEKDVKSIPTTATVKAGGQRLNHINTALRMTHIPSGITIVSQAERDQATNYIEGIKLLKQKLINISQLDNMAKINQIVEAFAGDKSRNEKDFTYNAYINMIKYHDGDISSSLNILENPEQFYQFLLRVAWHFHSHKISSL